VDDDGEGGGGDGGDEGDGGDHKQRAEHTPNTTTTTQATTTTHAPRNTHGKFCCRASEQVPRLEHFLPRSIALKKVSTAAKAALVAGMPHRSKEVSSQQETPANREQARVRAELEAEVAMDDKDWQLVVSATVRRFVAVARLIDEFENLNRAECSLEAGASHPPYY